MSNINYQVIVFNDQLTELFNINKKIRIMIQTKN